MKTCQANHCKERIRSDMLMCRNHWFMVPKHIRDQVWNTLIAYREDRGPLQAYLDAASLAINSLQ